MRLAKITVIAFVLFALSLAPIFVQLATAQTTNEEMTQDEMSDEGEAEEVQEGPVNSYELFWPITAGRTTGDTLFLLKRAKEGVREFLIFSKYRKADYNMTLATKRLVEGEKLFIENDTKNAQKSLEMSLEKLTKAKGLMAEVESNGQDPTDLRNALNSTVEKHVRLVEYLATMYADSKDLLTAHASALRAL